tara:strand:- start:82638 stop:83126 length:489 start_codon:yes stop_codon:yes gene_type:complete
MYIDFPNYNEGPVAALMRLKSMSLAESKNDFRKRHVRVELSFLADKQRWQMVFYKNQQMIFLKTFSKTCRSSIGHWFRTYNLELDQESQVKIPWKSLESGEKWVVEAYVNRRYWSLLELPPELSLCQIIKWPENRKPRPRRNLFECEDMGKVIPLPIVKKRR